MEERLLRFLPAAIREGDRDDARRALLTVVSCWITSAIAALIAALQAGWGTRVGASAAGVAMVVSAGLPFLVRRSGKWRLVAALLCATVWGNAFALSALTGGELIAALYYLVFAPSLATLLIGPRTGIWIAVASTLASLGFYLLHLRGWAPPIAVDPQTGLHSAMRGALIFNLALGSLVAAYEWLRSRSLRDSAESERRYRALADYGPDLIAELDGDGRVLHTSAALGGSGASALQGRHALQAIHREDQGAVVSAIAQLEHQASVRLGPVRWLVRKDEFRWFEASITRFQHRSQRRFLVVARDITDRVALEARLRQSQKMQAIGQLASGLAHDFNNLLMVVSGYGEVIAAKLRGDDETLASLEEIQRAADQGAALTRRLVALSRPSTITRRKLDLNEVVRDGSRMLRVLLGESIELDIDLDSTPAFVHADAGEIEQMLINLVANARDALPAGGSVQVRTRQRGGRVALCVQDDGVGIEPAVRDRIFEPFYTTKTPGQGTGLGLYVVHSIATDLGGEIHLHSEPGKGTVFTIELPAVVGEAAPSQVGGGNGAAGGSEHILLVEDRAELRALMREGLESLGYRVTVAADGIEALALGASAPIDLVVTDLVMPRMGGRALVAALRRQRPGLRALLISGHPETPRSDAASAEARERVLRKPFPIRELQKAVRESLDAR